MNRWSSITIIAFILLAIVNAGPFIPGLYDPIRPQEAASNHTAPRTGDPQLSEERREYILYGNERGGGHLHGIDKDCKSEFPPNWSETRIIETVKKLAANDNAGWRREENGYYVSEQKFANLDIRIVLDEQRDQIITAYPVNVEPNQCPQSTD